MSPPTTRAPDRYHVEIAWGLPRNSAYPDDSRLSDWAARTLASVDAPASEVSIRMMDAAEIAELNARYRGKEGPTNVLSFPADVPLGDGVQMLGDIAICSDVVEAEALEQGKPLAAHAAHMLVHGVLHLLGHDHGQEPAALEMEKIEAEIMADFGFPDPYQSPYPADGRGHQQE